MVYKIVSVFFIVLFVIGVCVFFIKPEVFDTRSVVYDRFYSGSELIRRIEDREIAQFPKTIGRLALYGPTDREVGISVDSDCRFSDPNICSKMFRLQYRDAMGNAYFINISKFKEGKSPTDIYRYITTASPTIDGNYFRFAKHEIGWISEERLSFVIVQKGVCQIVNNQPETCSYPNAIATDDAMVKSFVSQFPVSALKAE